MPGTWTLEQGAVFAKSVAAARRSRITREPFIFNAREAVPEDWTEEQVKQLNRVVWALVNTPLTWEAIESIWSECIMVRNGTTSTESRSDLSRSPLSRSGVSRSTHPPTSSFPTCYTTSLGGSIGTLLRRVRLCRD